MQVQYGAFPIVRWSLGWSLSQMQAQHRWSTLPLLQRRILQKLKKSHHQQKGLRALQLPPGGGLRKNLQPNQWTMSLQGRRHRSRVQSMRQRLSAKRISYCPLHQGTPILLLRHAPRLWVPRPCRSRGRQLCRLSDLYQENNHAQVLLHGLCLLGDHQGS